VLFITFHLKVTLLVITVVSLVILYIVAMCQMTGLPLNTLTALNINLAMGVSIDFAAHIAHKYLATQAPSHLKTDQQQRDYKVSQAVSQMGSSIIHGGLSTLLAISVMAMGQTYFFHIVFVCWTTLLIFGMLNGIILQPIVLSIIGPVDYSDNVSEASMDIQNWVELQKKDKINKVNKEISNS